MFFSALASRSGFEAVISYVVVHACIVFCNAMSANRNVLAASRFLGATPACIILWSLLRLNIANRIGMAESRLRW